MLSGHLGALTRVMGRDARTPTGDRTYGLVGVHRLIRVPGTWGCRPTHNMLLCMLAARLVACAHAAVWVCDVAWAWRAVRLTTDRWAGGPAGRQSLEVRLRFLTEGVGVVLDGRHLESRILIS